MSRHKNVRLGLGTIATLLIILVVVAILGTYTVTFYKSNFRFFKEDVATSYANIVNSRKESLNIENFVYHNSTQSFNLTLTNTGNIGITIKNVTLQDPTGNTIKSKVTAISTPIAIDNTGASKTFNGATSATISNFAIGSGDNRLLVVIAGYNTDSDPPSSLSCSYGAQLMTLKSSKIVGGSISQLYFFTLLSPTTSTTTNIQCNWGGGITTSDGSMGAYSLTGVDQTATFGTPVTASGTTSPASLTVTTTTANSWIIVGASVASTGASPTITAAGTQTQRFNAVNSASPYAATGGSTNATKSTGSYLMSWTLTSSNSWTEIGIEVKPASSSSSSSLKSSSLLIPGSLCGILPGHSCNVGLAYTCVTSPVSVSVTTTRGNTLKTTYVPTISWFDSKLMFRKAIAINNAGVTGQLYNFTALINMTDTNLKYNARPDGNDIAFTACDGKTLLNYQIENYTSSTGSLVAWVKTPVLYNTTKNVIYMYYGNSAASKSSQNGTATWDSKYAGVWHFNRIPSPLFDNLNTWTGMTNSTGGYTTPTSFTIGSGSNQLLIVEVMTNNAVPTKVYWGDTSGTLMTQKIGDSADHPGGSIWYLTGASGTRKITIIGGATSKELSVGVYSLFNVDQTNPVPTSAQLAGTGTSLSLSIVNQYAGSWVLDLAAYDDPILLSAPTQTQEFSIQDGKNAMASSYAGPLPAGANTTFGWSISPSNLWLELAVEIKAGPASVYVPDSTSNHNDLTPTSMSSSDQIQGQIAGALNFDGSTKYLSRTSSLNKMPAANAAQTGSFWFWVSSNPSSGNQNIYSLENSGSSSSVQAGFTAPNLGVWKYGGTSLVSTSPPTAGIWHYAVYTYNATAPIKNNLYIDGVLQPPTSTATNAAAPSSLYVGKYSGGDYFNGEIDELRISTITRSANWISTEYNSQVSPSSFYKIGPVENYLDARTSK